MKLLMVVSNDNEDVESLGTAALLKRAGFDVFKGTFQPDLTIHTAYGTTYQADGKIPKDISPFEGLIIPGGKYVQATVDEDTEIKALARTFKIQDKYLMALCAGPRFLMQADLIDGNFTCYPGAEKDQIRGHYLKGQKAVVDGRLITARSAGSVYDFVFAIIETLKGKKALESFQKNIAY